MTTLLLYAAFTLGVSFTCSVLEAVLLSVTPSYLAHLETTDERRAAIWHELKLHIDRPLAAILSLNTIANTFGAAMVGAQAQHLWGMEVLTAASVLLTLLVLLFSEITPKTLGATWWRELAPAAAPVIRLLTQVLGPLVWVTQRLSSALRRGASGGAMQREELTALAELGGDQGLLNAFESRVMTSLLGFRDVRVSDIMTPRPVVCLLHASDRVREVIHNEQAMRFSRIPVWEQSPDDIVGYVLKNEILLHVARGGPDIPVADLAHPFLIVPETLPVASLLDQLLERRERVALCLNEYGGFDGIATLEDVIETLLGTEIVGKLEPAADMRALARSRWRERAQRMGIAQEPSESTGKTVVSRPTDDG
jgi:CBS domain containing-hemolysin-like protein